MQQIVWKLRLFESAHQIEAQRTSQQTPAIDGLSSLLIRFIIIADHLQPILDQNWRKTQWIDILDFFKGSEAFEVDTLIGELFILGFGGTSMPTVLSLPKFIAFLLFLRLVFIF